MKTLSLVLIGSLTLLAPACAPQIQVDVEAEKSALMAADAAWSETVNNPEKFVAFFDEAGSMYAPGAPRATGHEAIQGLFIQLGSLPNLEFTWSPTGATVSASGDLGYTVGSTHMMFDNPEGNRMMEVGKYVTVWKKQADGSWKVIEDIFNNDAPAAPEE